MERRAVERHSAEFVARCASLGRATDSRLLNISQQGCLIDLAEPILAERNPVRLRIPGVSSLDGRVTWIEGQRAGITFAMPLHPAVVDYIAGCLNPETAERLGVGSLDSAR